MEAVICEIKELRRKHEEAEAQHETRVVFEDVMRELERHSSKGRTKPSNIVNRNYYGAGFYNWCLRYLGY